MSPPLLLHAFPTFAIGGAQVRFTTIANHFGRQFRHVVVAMDGNLAARERLDPGLDVSFPSLSLAKGDTIRTIRQLRAALRAIRPDTLVTSNWGTMEWSMANRLPRVREVHVEDGFGPEERTTQLPRRVWTRRIVLARRTVVVPSLNLRRIATDIWRLDPARIRYVPNGVDLSRFAARSAAVPAATWPGEGPVIGTVTALRPEKNLQRLLRAFAAVPPPARLVIVGAGSERPALESLARDLGVTPRLHWTGHQPDPAAFIRGFDIFALSSDTEQMPLSLLEAMAASLAVASTDVGDVAAMLPPEQRPFITPLDDQALGAALARLCADPAERARLGAANRARADLAELEAAAAALRAARRPVVVAGGGVLYAGAERRLAAFAETHGMPVVETQAGKSALPDSHPHCMGAVGVTGTGASNALVAEADLLLAVGTRLADFTTGSAALIGGTPAGIVMLNVAGFDAGKFGALPLVADAAVGLDGLDAALGDARAPSAWTDRMALREGGLGRDRGGLHGGFGRPLPSDAQVIGAVQRAGRPSDVVVCAAGGLPGELHKLWKTGDALGYHLEYGYSCMGYEIAGGLGVKMALPDREVIVMVGDGSYLMLNSEIATSVMLGVKLTIVLLDNGGYGCINRLQQECGGAPFQQHAGGLRRHVTLPAIDFVAHARSLGAEAQKVGSIAELEEALSGVPRAKTRHPGDPDRHRRRPLDGRRGALVGRGGARGLGAPRGRRGARRITRRRQRRQRFAN